MSLKMSLYMREHFVLNILVYHVCVAYYQPIKLCQENTSSRVENL